MISRDEWLAALSEASAPPPQDPNVLSLRELGELWGVGGSATARHAQRLVKTGKAERTTKVIQMTDGRLRKVPALRLLKRKK